MHTLEVSEIKFGTFLEQDNRVCTGKVLAYYSASVIVNVSSVLSLPLFSDCSCSRLSCQLFRGWCVTFFSLMLPTSFKTFVMRRCFISIDSLDGVGKQSNALRMGFERLWWARIITYENKCFHTFSLVRPCWVPTITHCKEGQSHPVSWFKTSDSFFLSLSTHT